ncbi:MAG: bifunctional salicylyl-CoA 5-hydroxylase/oxidoreductase [Gemmatimonadetes bacterium]|nr:bifunctional salicylyl-CoA 5-hydroxylase/oxidoreductase [Gemmatimonadota bacterium]
MKVAIIGGGPAGLYLALLLRRADAAHDVTVIERNRADDTFGWGVVFSDQTLVNLRAADRASHDAIATSFAHWDDIDIHYRGRTITSSGHGFSGIARKRLLNILQEHARAAGAKLRFQCEVVDRSSLSAAGVESPDVIVGADGVNSTVRRRHEAAFQTALDVRHGARYIWLGTTLPLDAFTFIIVLNDAGVFQAHAYRFDESWSTFIVECDDASWRAAGFAAMDVDATVAACERMFEPWLHGHRLYANARHQTDAPWLNFLRVSNQRWYDGNVVLLGDAAHTAHFSIGSGTKLAMEDAMVLARELAAAVEGAASGARLTEAFERYQEERRTEALRLQNAARNSMEWFENVRRYVHLEPEQFAYALLTRSQRVSHENLRLRDRAWLEEVERWFAARATTTANESVSASAGARAPATPMKSPPRTSPARRTRAASPADPEPRAAPPIFTPFVLRSLRLPNRIVVAPMDMYTAVDGVPNDFHLVHLGSLALGGAGLVLTEMTCVSREGRISPGCTGMYVPAHGPAWTRIVEFVHAHSPAKFCLQLGHSGRKGSTRLMWEGMDEPLEHDSWDVVGPSPVPWTANNPVPHEMTRADMEEVLQQFVRATEMGAGAGFDMLELHAAHGYLLSSFLTPLSNLRTDAYGGSLDNRLRYPLEVFRAMREVWPAALPMSVRISATDWADGGVDAGEGVAIARAFGVAGADVIHVSTGQTSPAAKPVYGRMFQTPFSDRIRNETGLPTIAVGNITDADQANSIIAAGRADLCALARPHLADPRWTQHAAAELGWSEQWWPVQWVTGKRQLERLIERRREMERAERALREDDDG